jgi:hypothetical protein
MIDAADEGLQLLAGVIAGWAPMRVDWLGEPYWTKPLNLQKPFA